MVAGCCCRRRAPRTALVAAVVCIVTTAARTHLTKADDESLKMPIPPPVGTAIRQNISWDSRSFLVNGKRLLLTGGEVDYARSTPGMWPTIMKRAKQNGLNCIASYVFWNLHRESESATLRFDGRRNLRLFLREAQSAGLWVHLRLGPYINGNWHYGGLPMWLRHKPGIEFRADEPQYIHYMTEWVRTITTELRDLFADRGGPIIATQIENEYNTNADDSYMGKLLRITNDMGIKVPWTFCENPPTGAHTVGAYPGWIFTCNHESCTASNDGHYLQLFRRLYPGIPAMYTEVGSCDPLWTNYETFDPGQGCPTTASSSAFKIARWFAMGGISSNYFEWFGGNNYGLWGSHDTTTAYHGSSALNHFGLPNEPKYSHLGRLHKLLQLYSPTLLQQDPPTPIPLGGTPAFGSGGSLQDYGQSASMTEYQEAHVWPAVGAGTGQTGLVFLSNLVTSEDATIRWRGKLVTLAAWSVLILDGRDSSVLFDSSDVHRRSSSQQPLGAQLDPGTQIHPLVNASGMTLAWWAEPTKIEEAQAEAKAAAGMTIPLQTFRNPPDQLDVTLSDFAFYDTAFDLTLTQNSTTDDDWWLRITLPPSTGVTVFVDGIPTGTQNNAGQGLFSNASFWVPLPPPQQQQRGDSTTRHVVVTLLATSFGTDDDHPTPRKGDPRQQRRGILETQLINLGAGLGPCAVALRGFYCSPNHTLTLPAAPNVNSCWVEAAKNAACGDEIVWASSNDPCFCVREGLECVPASSTVGNSVYNCTRPPSNPRTSGQDTSYVHSATTKGWRVRPGVLGQLLQLANSSNHPVVQWQPDPPVMQSAVWIRGSFPTPANENACQALAIDMSGFGRGHVFVNGHDLGRYWLTRPSTLYQAGPIQRFYQVPVDWLCSEDSCRNSLVVFEVQGAKSYHELAVVQVLPSQY